ncbi:hypothetical protein [Haladaptatus sp. DYSN1]|uniref:DUF7513 family protein n=1 Tax=unclassified Haladaptatus TaxID=2622732 RepID=UPI0024073487|nr:hypothetical protein [Haladaptatus sp. DYSN1]
MSFLSNLFRTSTPSFEPGQEFSVFITGYDTDGAVARVGDTHLFVDGATEAHVDEKVRVRVLEFDDDAFEGKAELLNGA